MCLNIDKELTKYYKKRKNETFTFYKWYGYDRETKKIETPYQDVEIKSFGIIKAKGVFNWFKYFIDKEIHGGACHAYINGEFKQRYNNICLPIKVKGKDIIAAGDDNDICFRKYEISEEIWNKAMFKLKAFNSR